jgi:hypothetical protein
VVVTMMQQHIVCVLPMWGTLLSVEDKSDLCMADCCCRAVTVPNVLSLYSLPGSPRGGSSSVPQSPDWQALKQRKHPVLEPPVQPVEPLEP